MDTKSLNYRVGLFVLASGGLFLLLTVFAIGAHLTKAKRFYVIHFLESVKGMVIGSPVNFQGVKIGSVVDVRFVGGLTEVTIRVDPNKAPIQTATSASLDRAWVTGQVTIELGGWHPDGVSLPEYGVIEAELSPGAVVMQSLPEVVERVGEILEQFDGAARGLNRLMRSDSALIGEMTDALLAVERTGRRLDRLLSDTNLDRVEHILGHVETGLGRIQRETMPEVDVVLRRFSRVVGNLEALTEAAARVELPVAGRELMVALTRELPKLGRVSEELEVFLRGNRRDFAHTLSQLQSTLREIHGLARVLQTTPSALLWGTTLPEEAKRHIRVPALPPAGSGGKE